jgi:hypothetical protein
MATNSVSPKIGKITDVPAEPIIGTATAGAERATVTFTANTSGKGGAVRSYVATSNPGGITGTATTSPISVSGLTPSTAYTFTVSGVGISGQGYPSDASNSVTPTVANYYAQTISSPSKFLLSVANGKSMPVDSSGNAYIAAHVSTNTSASAVMGAAKITSTGIAWNTSITATSGNHGSIGNNFVDSSGNFYFLIPQDSPSALKIYKLSSTGSITWQKILTAQNAGSGALAVDSSGNVVIAAQSWNGSNYDGCLIKLDSSGNLTWQKKLSSSNSYDYFEDLTIDSSGNIYTCGFMFINDTSNVIAKYNSSGDLQWQRKLTGSGGGTPPLYGIIVESGGSNIYVNGTVSDSGPTSRWTTAKYNSSGTIQWQRTLSSDTGASSGNGNIAVDSSNNVYVTGSGTVSSVTLQRLAKYNSSGTIQWQRSFAVTGYSPEILSVSVVSNKMYIELLVDYKILNLVLPDDGTATGTYTISGYTVSYATSTLTAATPSYTDAAQNWTAATNTTYSLSTNTETSAAGDLTITKTGIA